MESRSPANHKSLLYKKKMRGQKIKKLKESHLKNRNFKSSNNLSTGRTAQFLGISRNKGIEIEDRDEKKKKGEILQRVWTEKGEVKFEGLLAKVFWGGERKTERVRDPLPMLKGPSLRRSFKLQLYPPSFIHTERGLINVIFGSLLNSSRFIFSTFKVKLFFVPFEFWTRQD